MDKILIKCKSGRNSGYASGSTTDSEAERQDRYFLPKWRQTPLPEALPLPRFLDRPKLV